MKLSAHIAQAACLGPAAYYLSDLQTALIFSASVVLIDVDHYLHYIYRKKDMSVRGMFLFYDDVWERRGALFGISFFHTAEVLLLLVAAGFRWSGCWAVAAGFLVHMFFDLLHLYRHEVFFMRALSIIEFFIRKKKYSPELIW